MIEEQQILNHWLRSKDTGYLRNLGIDQSYFTTLRDVVEWIDSYVSKNQALPTLLMTSTQFGDFKVYEELDSPGYLVDALKEAKAYKEFRPVLTSGAEMVNAGKTIDAMWKMRNDIDGLIKNYASGMSHYDWVQDAKSRYDKYMERHGITGLQGFTTGIPSLDELTGGWKDDDFILLAGRTNEGKSYLATYFAWAVWRSLLATESTAPVVYFSTEMPELEVAYRLDTLNAHFSNRGLNNGGLTDPEMYSDYLNELAKKKNGFIIISQDANMGKQFTPQDVLTVIEREKPAFVVCDQIYDFSDGSGERDIRRKIVNVTRELRDINLFTMTPLLVLAQAGRVAAQEGRKNKDATPELDQIQESDNPAQKATRVLTIRLLEKTMKVSLKKNRGGPRDKDIFMVPDWDTGIWHESQPSDVF